MGKAQRSFAAFRLTEQEQEEVRKNDEDLILDPRTGDLNPKPTEKPEEPKARPQPFRISPQYID